MEAIAQDSANDCDDCPRGTYLDCGYGTGPSQGTQCPSNGVWEDPLTKLVWTDGWNDGSGNDEAADCQLCAAGQYQDDTAMSSKTDCIVCVPGKYVEAMGSDASGDCTICPTGTYVETSGR